jgi:type IV pilus assembly protein PilO
VNNIRKYLTKLNLHLVALAAIVVIDILLGVRFALAWSAIRSDQSGNFVQEQVRYGQLLAQMKHLNGLPERVQQADVDAQKFYDARIAPNYSTVVAQLDGTAVKDQVRLARDEYAQAQVAGGLTEVQIDAGLSGQYTDLMHFINDLERDKDHVFFTIENIAFTGQQGGLVNVRLRLITYLRAGAPDLPPATPPAPAAAAPTGGAR